jgi:tetratricopeptide (TPR) repeat protein
VLCFLSFFGWSVSYGQIVPQSPEEDPSETNSFDYQNRVIDADNAISLAHSSLERRDYRQASLLIAEAIKIYSRHNRKESVGKSFMLLGFINRELGNSHAADIYFRNALVSYRDADDFFNSGKVAGMLGNIYLSQGLVPKACRSWDVAYEFFRQVGDEFFAQKSFDLIRQYDCPDVIKHLSPEEAFPEPSVEVGTDAYVIDLLLGRVPETYSLDAPVLGGDGEEGSTDFASISQEGRGVLDALRVDALTKNAEELLLQAEEGDVSEEKRELLLREAEDIFTRLENYDRVLEIQLRLARNARSKNKVVKMQGFYNAAVNTARIMDDFEEVVSIDLEFSDGLKEAEEYDEAGKVALRARKVAERLDNTPLLMSALDGLAEVYLVQNRKEEGCEVLTEVVRNGDELGEGFLVGERLLVMARYDCASPGGVLNSYEGLSGDEKKMLRQHMMEIASVVRTQQGLEGETRYFLRLAQYLLDRQDYDWAESAYLAAADMQSKEGNYDQVTNIMQSLLALARLTQDEEKRQFYSLRVRTSRLDVLHRDKTPIELGNLGIDSAQEGDVDAACYFWDRALEGLEVGKDASIISVVSSLNEDYKCKERLEGLVDSDFGN